ncbi:MAG: hypothetical protein ABIG30_02440 [Candidatus Aenigmatarchaeota archaeon]
MEEEFMSASKGQMFIIGAIIVIVGIISLRGIMDVHRVLEEQSLLESDVLGNIAVEFNNIAVITDLQNYEDYFDDFSSYVRANVDVEIFYLYVYKGKDSYTVIVGNFLGVDTNATLNDNYLGVIEDGQTVRRTLESGENIDITYGDDAERFELDAVNSNSAVFYDIAVHGRTGFSREKNFFEVRK